MTKIMLNHNQFGIKLYVNDKYIGMFDTEIAAIYFAFNNDYLNIEVTRKVSDI